jgi:peptidoglycan/LPS O-acetylase OafA/YrhL
MTNRLPGLDGIRAISISLVIVFHLTVSTGLKPFTAGAFGVDILDIFFVLSGFLITWLLCSEETKTGTISLRAFYSRRALRILPPALIYLAAIVLLTRFGWGSVSLGDIASCLFFVRNLNLVPASSATAHY